MQVPLNYSEPSGGSAAIAVIRIKSPLLISGSEDYRGPILFNPGGPGGSGVDFLLRTGKSLATIVGPQFDVVSFDPRGPSIFLQLVFPDSSLPRSGSVNSRCIIF